MKHKLIIASLALASVGTLCLKSQNQHNPIPRRSEAVFLWGKQSIYDGTYYGAQVYVSSSSEGAPQFPQYPSTNLVELGEATAQLLSLGYQIKVSDNGLQVIATKP